MVAVLGGYGLAWLSNRSRKPAEAFAVATEEWHALMGSAELVLHSHPNGSPVPSLADQRQQLATSVPWYVKPKGCDGFFFGDGSPEVPLLARGYRWGVTDCYSVVRDAFWQLRGIRLKNHPRDYESFRRGLPFFDSRFKKEGFEKISESIADAKVGDCVLFKIRAETSNHCGYVVSPGVMLHHPSARNTYSPSWLARRERLERWGFLPLSVLRWRHD
ncbi:MAG: hypothetical protein CMQ40_12780 [Gammaproteobacteria bacterium]|nr:hypothetical protein [Gammaproteobacteria bacterium]